MGNCFKNKYIDYSFLMGLKNKKGIELTKFLLDFTEFKVL